METIKIEKPIQPTLQKFLQDDLNIYINDKLGKKKERVEVRINDSYYLEKLHVLEYKIYINLKHDICDDSILFTVNTLDKKIKIIHVVSDMFNTIKALEELEEEIDLSIQKYFRDFL